MERQQSLQNKKVPIEQLNEYVNLHGQQISALIGLMGNALS